MRLTRWKISIYFRRGTAVLLMLAAIACAIPVYADTVIRYDIENITGETQITLAEAALRKRMETDKGLENIHIYQDGQIYGRGISDEPSGSEPDYIGLVGYAAVVNNEEFTPDPDGIGVPWTVPAYMLYEKRWYYTKSMQHKTGVLVIRQMLKEVAHGRYTGRLMVIRLNTNEVCWMDVENFVTVPYWFYPARRAVRYGNTVASYSRQGQRLPTDEDGNPVEVADDTDVLIPGFGVWDKRPPEGSRMIPGIIYEERTIIREKRQKKETAGEQTETGETEEAEEAAESKEFEEYTETVMTVLLFPEEDLTMIY